MAGGAIWGSAAAFIVVNLRSVPATVRPPLVVAGVGFSLNSLLTALNGGMPFSMTAARAAGVSEQQLAERLVGHVPLGQHGAMAAFADVIPVPGLHKVVSIGDLLLMGGIVWLFMSGADARQVAPGAGRPRHALQA